MKIGILTFFYINNYGAVLQAVALQDYLKNNSSAIVEMIPYKSKEMLIDDSPNPFYGKTLKNKLKRMINFPIRFNQYIKFEKFIQKFKYEYDGNFEEYDVVIVGSDQVWNTAITHEDYTYFLDMEMKASKYSYAASMGKYDYSDEEKRKINNLLHQFKGIGVREYEAQKYLKTLGINSQVVVDPVFLQPKRYWDELAKKVENKNYEEKYAVYYSLQENEKLISKTNQLVREEKRKVFAVHPHATKQDIMAKQLYCVGPEEFVALIKFSELVITNSFHALAFSIIFRKKVLFSFHKNTGSRGKNLLELMGINFDENESGIIEVDFKNVNTTNLDKQIEVSKEYLNTLLEKEEILK